MTRNEFEQNSEILNNQCVIDDVDLEKLRIQGYYENRIFGHVYLTGCILTLGILPLICYWKPEIKLYLTHNISDLSKCSSILIQTSEGKYIHRITTLKLTENSIKKVKLLEKYVSNGICRYFNHRQLRFYWVNSSFTFIPNIGMDEFMTFGSIYDQSGGLSEADRTERFKIFSQNLIYVIIKPFLRIFAEGLIDPFYIIQILAVCIWFWDRYVYFASAISVILIASLLVSTYHQRTNLKHLQEMVYLSTKVKILCEGKVTEVLSNTLVPGDVMVLSEPDVTLPCDAILLSGNCIVNESMLTGESFPTTKTPLEINTGEENKIFYRNQNAKNVLYCGTKVSQVRFYKDALVLALVLSTGFSTMKGSMIRSVIYPKNIKFTFFRDSLKFILILAILSAGGLMYSIYTFVKAGVEIQLIARKALDVIFIVIPPSLPAALNLSVIYSMNRLRKFKIACIESSRVNICGKIKLFCFDKTGTLTQEGIDVSGALICNNSKFQESIIEDITTIEGTHVHRCMTSCHSLSQINGHLVGDPLEYVIFKATGWEFIEGGEDDITKENEEDVTKFNTICPNIVRPPKNASLDISNKDLAIVRIFQFQSELQRMSVIVRELSTNTFFCYMKGAPEIIAKMCRPETLPSNFSEILFDYTRLGYRVLAAGCKTMPTHFSWHKAQKLLREEVDCNMEFIGLLILKNKLKPNSKQVIHTLTSAGIRTLMITGDNLLTAVSVASECGMLAAHKNILKIEVMAELSKEDMNDPVIGMQENKAFKIIALEAPSPYKLLIEKLNNAEFFSQAKAASAFDIKNYDISHKSNVQLVIEGKHFTIIRQHEPDFYTKLLVSGVVFARMSPINKTQLIEDLRNLGYVVGMCGDGANDCGALKAAHAGISIAATEASVVAPFSSIETCPSCVLKLIAEGRASMVTAFSMFKYIILYSLTQFTSIMFLYSYSTNLSDFDFLFVDLFLTTPLIATMIRARPRYHLVQTRPLGRLVHPLIFVSFFGHFVIQVCVHVVSLYLLSKEPWYVPVPPTADPSSLDYLVQPTAIIFTVTNFIYIYHSIAVSMGPPYREVFFYNNSYMSTLIATFLCCIAFVIYPGHTSVNLFQLADLANFNFRLKILAFVLGCGIVSITYEYAINYIPFIVKFIKNLSFKKRPRNLYKLTINEINNSDIFQMDA